MGANTFGQRFQMMSFGERHGPAYGVVIDGMPAGVRYDEALLLKNLIILGLFFRVKVFRLFVVQ